MRYLIPVLLTAGLLAACGKPGDGSAGAKAVSAASAASAADSKTAAKPAAKLLLAPEDLLTLQASSLAAGPVITGAVLPEKRADLRAEVAAVVVQVYKDNGETVRAGDLLLRLDDTAIRDSLGSAEEALRASTQAFEQAERQVQRQKTLQAQGMTSTQALEDAEVRRNNAQSDLVAARSRVVSARQQMQRTSVRAPFDGVVSERKASAGDTAQIGKELVKVIDPRSMRFEGLVTADRLGELKVGQAVSFRINGFSDREFTGRMQRIAATVNTLASQHVGEQIVLVAHGGVMDALYRLATRQEIESPRTWDLGNAAINRLLWTPDGLSLVGWSDTRHLDDATLDETST